MMQHSRLGPTIVMQHISPECMPLQEGLVPFNIGVAVRGDITLGVWFGHRNLGQRLHSRAAFSFAFHTAFVESGADRVQLPMLDISNKVGPIWCIPIKSLHVTLFDCAKLGRSCTFAPV